MTATRLPVSVTTSIVLHTAVLGLWIFTMSQAAKHKTTVIGNVDFIQVKKVASTAKPAPAAKPAQSTFDFLKMALPAVQRVSPQSLQVKLPDARKPLQVDAPKLKDRGRLDTGPKLDMDLGKAKNIDMAKVEARIPERKLAALAAMPRLEDVGRRRVANLPQAIAMEERRQEAMGLKGTAALSAATSRRDVGGAMNALHEAAPASGSRFAQKISSLLPEQRLDMKPAVMPSQPIRGAIEQPESKPARKAQQLEASEKKGVEIEGPLADRKVMAYEIPEFPAWAKDQGVLEANVSIRFWVNKDGDVLPNMRVEHTSGYGRLDKLSMESLAKWKFAPLLTGEKQWGVITFRFLLE